MGPDESVVITGEATIDGKISVNGGTVLILDGLTVDGKIEGTVGGCLYIEGAARIDGQVETKGATCLTVIDTPEGRGQDLVER